MKVRHGVRGAATLALLSACQGPERLAVDRTATTDPRASDRDSDAVNSEQPTDSLRVDAAVSDANRVCELVRSVEFFTQHSRMSDLRVSAAPDGVFLGHGGPNSSSMLSYGGWDGAEVSLRSNNDEVYSGILPAVSPDGARFAVETYRGTGETGYAYHLMLRVVSVPDGIAAAEPIDVGTVAWDPRLTVTAAATARDSGHGVFAHASALDGRWIYLLRTNELNAADGFWSRSVGEGFSEPLLEVLPSAGGGVVSALYGDGGTDPVQWHVVSVPVDGQELREYDFALELQGVNLATSPRTVATVLLEDGTGLVWRDEAGHVGFVLADAEGDLERVTSELELPISSSLAAAAVGHELAIAACESNSCTLSLVDLEGRLLGDPVVFAGSTPSVVAVDEARLTLSYLTSTSRVVSDWDCE